MSPLARFCRWTTCTELVPADTPRCPTHTAEHARRLNNDPQANKRKNTHPRTRIYNDPRWKTTRLAVLNRDHWQCTIQLEGCTRKATIADHYPIDALHCPDPYDPRACRAACRHCSGVIDGRRSNHPTRRDDGQPPTAYVA